jgi:hypothetical protein
VGFIPIWVVLFPQDVSFLLDFSSVLALEAVPAGFVFPHFVYPAEPLLAFAACSSFSWLNSSGALHFTQDLAFFLLVS